MSVTEFFAMGGHGFYVWLCYGVSLVVVVANVVSVRGRHRRLLRELASQQARHGVGKAP